jgi:hypothetical protein
MSLFGDTCILVASIKYKAFVIHKVIVKFIQHIAVCDLFLSITYLSPIPISLIVDGWVLGSAICHLQPYVLAYTFVAGVLLICAMTATKLLLLKYHLRAKSWSAKHTHIACGGIWLLSFYLPMCLLIVEKDDVFFTYRTYSCFYMFSSKTWTMLTPISAIVFGVIPNIIIFVTSILLLKEARKVVRRSGESLKWQGVMTVLLTVTAYTVSYLPPVLYHIVSFVIKKPSEPGPFQREVVRFVASIVCLNTMANFFVYSLTVRSFRTFLLSKTRQILAFFQGRSIIEDGITAGKLQREGTSEDTGQITSKV